MDEKSESMEEWVHGRNGLQRTVFAHETSSSAPGCWMTVWKFKFCDPETRSGECQQQWADSNVPAYSERQAIRFRWLPHQPLCRSGGEGCEHATPRV